MPFPALVVWGVAALAAGTGVVKTVKAVKDNNKASKYSEEANDIVSKASRKAQEARERARKSLEDLGQTKLNVIESTIKNARTIEVLHNLIKNNGQDFNLTKDQLELAEKLV